MLFRLELVQPGKTSERELDFEKVQIQQMTGEAVAEDIHAEFQFRIDPMGFVVHYKVRAEVEVACVRCAGSLTQSIDTANWISLRTQHPQDGHVVLEQSEMDIRFIEDDVVNLEELTIECIEMELADYPRHKEGDPQCVSSEELESAEKSSPFDVLSKFLD